MENFNNLHSTFMIEAINAHENAMIKLQELLDKNNIEFVFIGGAILPDYGYSRYTEDFDILVNKDDKEKFNNLSIDFIKISKSGRSGYLHNPKVKIDILYSDDYIGSKGSGMKFPKPANITILNKLNNKILSIEKLIEYKLTSGIYGESRLSDFGDVQKLIKFNNLQKDLAKDFKKEIKNKYKEIWEQTK